MKCSKQFRIQQKLHGYSRETILLLPRKKMDSMLKGNNNELDPVQLLPISQSYDLPLISRQPTFRRWCNYNTILTKWVSLPYYCLGLAIILNLHPITQRVCMFHLLPCATHRKLLFVHLFLKQNHSGLHQTKSNLCFGDGDQLDMCPSPTLLYNSHWTVYGTLIHETVSGLKPRTLVSSLNSDTTWPCVFGPPTWTF